MRWEDMYKDAGFILLILLIIMIWGWAVTGCSTIEKCGSCPKWPEHGPCPI